MSGKEKIEPTLKFIREKAATFGAKNDEKTKDYVERNNTNELSFAEGIAYFGFIEPEEDTSGRIMIYRMWSFQTQTKRAG